MNNFETELIASEVGYFIRPKQSKWKMIAQGIVAALAIVGLVSLLLWLIGIGAL
jgi:hypothetical protein